MLFFAMGRPPSIPPPTPCAKTNRRTPVKLVTAAIGMATFIVNGFPQASATASQKERASRT